MRHCTKQTLMEMAKWNPEAHTLMSAVWLPVAGCVRPSSLPVGS